MDTHDEETKQFFAHSNVRVRLVYRGWRDQKNLIRCVCGLSMPRCTQIILDFA